MVMMFNNDLIDSTERELIRVTYKLNNYANFQQLIILNTALFNTLIFAFNEKKCVIAKNF